MKQVLFFFMVSLFSIFIGSQITEGALLLPYWQSLSSTDFYSYYAKFGPSIGRFYTVLTILAALIPIAVAIYCKAKNYNAFKHALLSSFFAILFVSSFYLYFKGTNDLFYLGALTELELKNELVTWGYWHWGRILIECASLFFLILSILNIQKIENN